MVFQSTSSLSWMDSSEHERRVMLELVSALNEPGTLDELGIGSVRDTIADLLFPGTSTIQTRARYFLFIPWILQSVEQGPGRQAEIAARQLQLQVCEALSQAHGPNEGVIGREAGATLRRWPISIYWQGLAQWGIRRFVGSMTSYFSHLRQPSRWGILGRPFDEDAEDVRDDTGDHVRGNWATLPPPPAGFPVSAVFALSPEEGEFLRERVTLNHPPELSCAFAQLGQGVGLRHCRHALGAHCDPYRICLHCERAAGRPPAWPRAPGRRASIQSHARRGPGRGGAHLGSFGRARHMVSGNARRGARPGRLGPNRHVVSAPFDEPEDSFTNHRIH